MWEELKMPSKLEFKTAGELEELLEKHETSNLSGDERVKLHELLKERYSYGDKMPEYKCPQCKKPLVLSWPSGPLCAFSEGGCGYSFS